MKRIILLISFFICIISILITFPAKAISNNKIIIDPGHGGMDCGAVANDIYESNLNLEISYQLKFIFELNGFHVDMTRYDENSLCNDKFVKKEDLNNRIELINSNNYLFCISIHQNKFTNKLYSGSQVFYSNTNPDNYLLAKSIENSIKIILKNTNRTSQQKNNTYLLNKIYIPTVLVECGFMSNDYELKLLTNSDYQFKLASSIFYGCMTFLDKL